MSPMGLADGAFIGEPWVKVEVLGDADPGVVILREDITSLGIQGVAPLEQQEIQFQEENSQGEQYMVGLTTPHR